MEGGGTGFDVFVRVACGIRCMFLTADDESVVCDWSISFCIVAKVECTRGDSVAGRATMNPEVALTLITSGRLRTECREYDY